MLRYAFYLLLCALVAAQYHNVTVKNLRLFDGNDEFFIKCLCYSPAPVGYMYNDPNAGGNGVCKQRQQYRIDANLKELTTVSACFYEDFFDGSVDASTGRPWFESVWTRDLPLIAATGANTVRIYHTNPITAGLVNSDSGYATKGYGSDYRPFMDAAASHGLKVVFPLFGEQAQLLTFPTAKMEEYIRSLVDNVGNHPALLMWQFGNELPLSVEDNNLGPTLIAKLNHFMDYARSYTFYRWGRIVPISHALVDLPSWYNRLVRDLKTDIITTNAGYRGPTYSDLWTGSPSQNFDGLHSLSCQYGKPVFIGEIGQHSTDGFINMNTWFTENWQSLQSNYENGAIGGALFEYSDEAWKAENQRTMGIVSVNAKNEATIKVNGGAYDYNAVKSAFSPDFWAGRPRHTLSTVDNSACSSYNFPAVVTPLYPFVDLNSPSTTPQASTSTYTVSSSSSQPTSTQTSTSATSSVVSSSSTSASATSATSSIEASSATTTAPTTTVDRAQDSSASTLYTGAALLLALLVIL